MYFTKEISKGWFCESKFFNSVVNKLIKVDFDCYQNGGVNRVYVFPAGSQCSNPSYKNTFLGYCMQSDKLGISKSLIWHLVNFTPHIGPATCVYFTNAYHYLILDIIIDV